jgi:sugar phosphate isomerase/epimerase
MKDDLSRRDLLRAAGWACAAAALPASLDALAGAPPGFFTAHHLPIGLQLYTLGDAVRDDLDGSFERLAKIGYRVLEPAGWHGHKPAELREAAKRQGLKCTSVHISARTGGPGPALDGDLSRLAADVHELGATDVVLSMFPVPERLGAARAGETIPAYIGRIAPQLTVDDWRRTAALLNDKGTALRGAGLRLGYHNHNCEFAPVGGSTGLDILLKETSSDSVVFELDTGWAAAAGVDPEALMRKNGRRFQLMHLKDVRASTKKNFTLRQDPAEVGSGKLDWSSLVPTAFESGIRKFYVEQEPPFTIDRFEAVARSYRHLAAVANVATGSTRI